MQVVSGDIHDLRLDNIHAFMNHCNPYFETRALEIVFVVPKTKSRVFQIGEVTGCGLLSPFPGWMMGNESNQCKILALEEKWEYPF